MNVFLPPSKNTTSPRSKVSRDTSGREDLIRDVLQEFPWACYAIAGLKKDAEKKHPDRSWRDRDYAGGTYENHLAYFTGKIGRHLAGIEIDGEIDGRETNQIHMAAVAWSALCYLDTMLRELAEAHRFSDPHELLLAIREGEIDLKERQNV